jgi:hypothetical protein
MGVDCCGMYRLDASHNGGRSQARRNGHRYIMRRGTGGELFDGAVGQMDLDLVGHGPFQNRGGVEIRLPLHFYKESGTSPVEAKG